MASSFPLLFFDIPILFASFLFPYSPHSHYYPRSHSIQVAQHLAKTYGDKAPRVAELACFTGRRWPVKGRRLVQEFPYIEADVKYAMKEYACTVVDVLARRTSLAFLNVQAAEEALPAIVEIMAKELGWDKKTIQVLLDVQVLPVFILFVYF